MSHSYSKKKGNRLYRYYVCQKAQKRGWDSCPAPSIPAGEIERFIVNEIKAIGRDPQVISATLEQVRVQTARQTEQLQAERADLHQELREAHAELGRLAATVGPGDSRLADAHDRIQEAERRSTEIEDELAALGGDALDRTEVAAALAEFDAVWACLAPREQERVIGLLVERVEYDGDGGNISISFRPSGIRTLVGELANTKDEVAA
ncbi:recombinase zinc beta ribbon domain-containing protein [Blastopirellula sp. J2-11]|uniref:zinc ribbon domain-containing protein n=1 Tax=Blastopirellula sp. J2-11 TaxID=2943192 RepID=UPI0021C5FBCB|nr:recombinase zinc beta ribbon domain-containing protein [Blastopirellula sp. J2-11]UUO05326.1 recombinase zinc beta ribbon domain-containing protein [Blastopirellula sp. J2-11]